MKIRKKENSYNLVCFYPGRVPQKAISKSTIRTVIALANRKHGQSYTVESSTTLFVPCACFYICFQPFKQASHHNCLPFSGLCSQDFLAFMPLQEFVVHFETGKKLWLTFKNAFVCFWLFNR